MAVLFVTGGTGFIGSHFLKAALLAGHQVRALRRPGSEPVIPIPDGVEWIKGDLENVTSAAFEGVEVLIHLAAAGVVQSLEASDVFRVNLQESLRMIEKAADAGARRLVICGSCFEYGKSAEQYEFIPSDAPLAPVTVYGASKAALSLAAQTLARERNLEAIILRPFHVFGDGEASSRFWPSLRRAALAGEDFPMTRGEQVRDFVPVARVASSFLNAVARADLNPGDPVIENVGTGVPKSLASFARELWDEFGGKGQLLLGAISYRPNEVMRYVPEISTAF